MPLNATKKTRLWWLGRRVVCSVLLALLLLHLSKHLFVFNAAFIIPTLVAFSDGGTKILAAASDIISVGVTTILALNKPTFIAALFIAFSRIKGLATSGARKQRDTQRDQKKSFVHAGILACLK
jgi:hypothetical protein